MPYPKDARYVIVLSDGRRLGPFSTAGAAVKAIPERFHVPGGYRLVVIGR